MYFTEKKDFQEFDKAKNRPRIVFCVYIKKCLNHFMMFTAQKRKFSCKDFFGKCEQIHFDLDSFN